MPVHKYHIKSPNGVQFQISYKEGKLYTITLPDEASIYFFFARTHEIPRKEKELKQSQLDYEFVPRGSKKTEENQEKKVSLHKACMDLYFQFYENRAGMKPRVGAAEGGALKKLLQYLKSQTETEQQAYTAFNAILTNWNHLPEFYRNQIDIKQINSNLNKILYEFRKQQLQVTRKEGRRDRIRSRRSEQAE